MLKKYLSLFSIFILYNFILAQAVTPPQPQVNAAGGPWTPGDLDDPTTPIDEYTIYLIGLAIVIAIVYYAINERKKSLI